MALDPAKPFDLNYEVMPNYDRVRLDLFVKAMIPSMSRTRIQQRISEDRVEVNGEARPANWRVLPGDRILIRCAVPDDGADAGKNIPVTIIYEDSDIIAINKQSGLVVHPVGKHRHDTLLNALYWRYKDALPQGESINLANRLDQYTSGVILATKHAAAKRIIQEAFEKRTPQKSYLALCRGIIKNDSGEINLPIGPNPKGLDHCRMMVRFDAEGKESLTRFTVEERFSQGFTLVRLHPVTGRQHQLRVHMSAVGHPLAADPRYGGGYRLEVRSVDGSNQHLDRYALHASELQFTHPITSEAMHIEAALAEDLATIVQAIREGAQEMVAGLSLTRE